jgi:hypothetical protein
MTAPLRELKAIEEIEKEPWARPMSELLNTANRLKREAQDRGETKLLEPVRVRVQRADGVRGQFQPGLCLCPCAGPPWLNFVATEHERVCSAWRILRLVTGAVEAGQSVAVRLSLSPKQHCDFL